MRVKVNQIAPTTKVCSWYGGVIGANSSTGVHIGYLTASCTCTARPMCRAWSEGREDAGGKGRGSASRQTRTNSCRIYRQCRSLRAYAFAPDD
eukprot:4510464-Pleurochrysis_carterae.AAC.2